MTHTDGAPAPNPPPSEDGYPGASEALEALRATLEALPADQVAPFRAPVARAVAFALRLARSYRRDRARFASTFNATAFNPAAYDDLEQRALALWAAEARLRVTQDAERALPALIAEATPVRRVMLRAAEYLWGDDPQRASAIAQIRSGRGHADVADDLIRLVTLFEEEWDHAVVNSAVSTDHLRAARRLSLEIARHLDDSDDDAAASSRRDLRDRAGQHLHAAVTEVRHAAAYVFRHDPDGLEGYPSLFNHHARRARRAPQALDADDDSSIEPETLMSSIDATEAGVEV